MVWGFFLDVSDICFSGRLSKAGFCIVSWSISSLLCSSLSSIFLFFLGVFQPIYGASHRSPQLQMSAEKTSALFLAPPVDARHIKTRAKGGKKDKPTAFGVRSNCYWQMSQSSSPSRFWRTSAKLTSANGYDVPLCSPQVSALLNTVRKVSSKHL